MFKFLKAAIIIGALLIATASIFQLFSVRAASASAVTKTAAVTQTVSVTQGDVAVTLTTTGNIQAGQNINLTFASSGNVTAINVKVGDYVLKGQTIATLDTQTALNAVVSAQEKLNAQQLVLDNLTAKPRQVDIDVAQANVAVAQASLGESQINPTDNIQVQIAQLGVQIANNSLWQAQLSRDINNSSRSPATNANNKSIDAATIAVTVAQAQLAVTNSQGANVGSIDGAKASLLSAQSALKTLTDPADPNDITQAQANLAAAQESLIQAQQTVANTSLIAPFDGLVAQVNLSLGQQAPTTTAVMLLAVDNFYVDVSIAELDIAKVKIGQPVNLNFDALPGVTLNGTVSQIASTQNTGIPVTYTVRVTFAPGKQPLLSTMSTTVNVIVSDAINVIRLANRYIRSDQPSGKVYASVRQADGTFKDVEIQLGTANANYTEVKSGLNVGDVVAAPIVMLSTNTGGSTTGGLGGQGGIGSGGLLRPGGG